MPLLTPDGKPAESIDKIMLLAMWSKTLSEEKHSTRPAIISAGMGKPTFPVNLFAAETGIYYWTQVALKSQKARRLLAEGGDDIKVCNQIAKMSAAIDYGDPRGDVVPRTKIAEALTCWYGKKVAIRPEHILFTVGGAGALHSIFSAINKRNPGGIILTPFPHYSLYTGPQGKNRLFPIPVMKEKGYRLTAASLSRHLDAAIAQAKKEGVKVSAILLCDPNNPLGTALTEDELRKIACVLESHPDIFIILDEAYAEMRFSGKHELSLLSVAPTLKDRTILMRSATKALSAAGERMAVIVVFNGTVRGELLEESVNVYGHAPRSLQYVFAEALKNLDHIELESSRRYYRRQVEYATACLLKMGAVMPDDSYRTGGAFYVLADLSDLLGQEISVEAERALGKRGRITTDEELIYSLLFDNGIAVAPLSYFGTSNRRGYVRITCSGSEIELEELMNRIQGRLAAARMTKQKQFENQLKVTLDQLNKFNSVKATEFRKLAKQALAYRTDSEIMNAKALKEINHALKNILSNARVALSVHVAEIKHTAATHLQASFRGRQGRKEAKEWKNEIDVKWRACVNANINSSEAEIRSALYAWPPSRRLNFQPWVAYLRKNHVGGSPAVTKKETPGHKPAWVARSKL